MSDCDSLDTEFNKLIDILEGKEKANEAVEIDLQNKQEFLQTKKFDIQPKASASAINDYIQKNHITAEQIVDMKITTRNDGMITVMLAWGRTNPIIIAGPIGPRGDQGDKGDSGLAGQDGKCGDI